MHTVLEAASHDRENVAVHHFIASELLISLELTHVVVSVAFIDCWDTTEFLVIPRIVLLIWCDNFLCNYAISSVLN